MIRFVSWTPSYKQWLYPSYFGFSAFFFKQVKLLQLSKSKQSKKAPEFRKKSVHIPHLIKAVKIKCRNLGGSKFNKATYFKTAFRVTTQTKTGAAAAQITAL